MKHLYNGSMGVWVTRTGLLVPEPFTSWLHEFTLVGWLLAKQTRSKLSINQISQQSDENYRPDIGRQRGGPIERTSLGSYLVVSAPSTWVSSSFKRTAHFSKLRIRVQKYVLSIRDSSPPLSTYRWHWRHWCDKMDQGFSLHFSILQAIKDCAKAWKWGYS